MQKPEILTNDAPADPDGSIFLSPEGLAVRDIDNQLFQMLLGRGALGKLEVNAKIELAERLRLQKIHLAEIAVKAGKSLTLR